MNIILVGYRGAGKTSIGPILAELLGWSFTDLDELIAQSANCSIAEIFAKEGETGFRQREREACLSLKYAKNRVIALGGGALTDPEVRALVRRLGKVIWLRAPAAVLWARISQDAKSAANRPDLTPVGGLTEVETVLRDREPLYRKTANHTIDTYPGSPRESADAIELWYRADDTPRDL